MLRDCTDSDRINQLSGPAEIFFYRLMMKADDYGSYHAKPSLIKAGLFPLRLDSIREADISRWITELEATKGPNGEKSGLIVLYEVGSKPYLRIVNFGQRLQNMKNKYPDPPIEALRESPLEVEVEQEDENELEMPRESLMDQFSIFWKAYGKDVGRISCEKLWCKISAENRKEILNVINKYVSSTPDKGFRKNPETYLINECWKDEIIIKEKDKPKEKQNFSEIKL